MNKQKREQWILHGKEHSGAYQVTGAANGSLRVCTVTNSPNDEANARLICAAPALLAACKALLRCVKQHPCFRFAISSAERAIAQAEGGKAEA